ncbi:MAG: hypothetical protein ACJAV1_003039 [Paraglaciecola sp.]|jgi:hypothetical protein
MAKCFSDIPDSRQQGKCIYSQHDVPLNGNDKTIMVNGFQYPFKNSSGKVTKTHSWVTDIEMNKTNVIAMTKAGRCRWKIENEHKNDNSRGLGTINGCDADADA